MVPSFPELTFQEESHVYHLEDIPIPSVTTVMNPLSQKHYQKISPEVLAKAAERGTAVHNAIEIYLNFGMEDILPQHQGYLQGFQQWQEKNQIKIIGTESRIYHKLFRYAGTVDLICEKDGKVTIVDFKTTSVLSPMLVGVQLEAYRQGLKSHGLEVEEVSALQLKKDGKYKEYSKIELPPKEECWQVFQYLLAIKNYTEKYK